MEIQKRNAACIIFEWRLNSVVYLYCDTVYLYHLRVYFNEDAMVHKKYNNKLLICPKLPDNNNFEIGRTLGNS